MKSSLVDNFITLFRGNDTAIGTEEGGCYRLDLDEPNLWAEYVEEHLKGTYPPIGVYPMVDQMEPFSAAPGVWMVHWGCIDFDEGEEVSWVHAVNVQRALILFGIKGWIERSRSKGYHVWVFANEWVPAQVMREALLAACQIADAPTREINPKQVTLGPGQLGNYVRLPYPGALNADVTVAINGRRRMVELAPSGNQRYVFDVSEFVSNAMESRTNVADLEKLAEHYTPPPRHMARRDWSAQVLQGPASDRLVGKARIIFEDGPLEGSDRSDTLWKLARYLYEDGRHTPEEAFELLVDADARWGKFADRPDRDQRIQDLVDKAWR